MPARARVQAAACRARKLREAADLADAASKGTAWTKFARRLDAKACKAKWREQRVKDSGVASGRKGQLRHRACPSTLNRPPWPPTHPTRTTRNTQQPPSTTTHTSHPHTPVRVVCAACGGSYAKGAYSSKQLRQNRARHRQRCRVCVKANCVVDPKHQDTVRAVEAGTALAPPAAVLQSPPSALLSAFVAALRHWEPGLVEIVEAVLHAQAPDRLTHLRPTTLTLDHLRAGGTGTGFGVAEDGRLMTCTRDCGSRHSGSVVLAPALRDGTCVGITLRRREYQQGHCVWKTNGAGYHAGLTIGVIGATARGATHGWCDAGDAYLAGQRISHHQGWSCSGWQDGDTAALMLDTAAGTLTLKHRRLGRAFVIDLGGGVPNWFLSVQHIDDADSIKVQLISTAEFHAFGLEEAKAIRKRTPRTPPAAPTPWHGNLGGYGCGHDGRDYDNIPAGYYYQT